MTETTPTPTEQEQTEMLAALLLHTLTRAGTDGLDIEQITRQAERNFDADDQRGEVAAALALLAAEDLAIQDGTERWTATRAALAAARLSF